MNVKRFLVLALVLCLAAALLSPAGRAADDEAPVKFSDRWAPLLEQLDGLAGWLDGQAERLAPELRETLRDLDTDALFSDLRDLASGSRHMSDEALRAAVLALAQKHGIHLADGQAEQLMSLCRALEKLDPGQLRERFDALERELDADSVPGGLRGAWNAVVKAVTDAADWVARLVGGLFK
jgi:hypothetical protein